MNPTSDKPEVKETKVDYSDPKFLDEQIKMAEQALQQAEGEASARINFLRGNLNALNAIKDGKPIVSKTPEPPQRDSSTTERPG